MKDNMTHGVAVRVPVKQSANDCEAVTSKFSLRKILGHVLNNLSLTTQRCLLLLFILLQVSLFVGHLAYQRNRIEDNTARILRNTALLEAKQFETSMDALRYQVRVIGNAILLNHTVTLDNVEPFLAQELKRDWLDAVIIFDANGDFVAKGGVFPLEQAIQASTLSRASFRDRLLFKDLRSEKITESLFYWQSNGLDPGIMGFVMYRAIRDPQGRYLGGIVGFFGSNGMEKLFRQMEGNGFDLGPGGVMTVLDRNTAIQLARMGAGTGSVSTHSDPRLLPLMDYASDVARAHHYLSPVDGVTRMGVFLNLNEGKWVLAVGMAKDDMLRGWYFQVFWTTLAMIILAMLQWRLLSHMRTIFVQRERLAREARQDPLTGLANRRRFDEWAKGTCNLAQRHQQPLCVMTLDLDFFKKINDSYGHDGGDAVLRCVGNVLQGLLRGSDIAARFGGEEFVVAMAHTEVELANKVAESIRASFAAQEVEFNGQQIRFTASIGLTQMTPGELEMSDGIHAALARADQALYRSKQEGRNRVTIAHSTMPMNHSAAIA